MEPLEKSKKKPDAKLIPYKDPVNHKWEIGIDEAGRGPLFGRLYVAGAVVPKPGPIPTSSIPIQATHAYAPFRYDWMKDSKRFTNEKKITEVADHIKTNAPFWTVKWADPQLIDEINIRQAVLRLMRECCVDIIGQIKAVDPECDVAKDIYLLIDGNDFPIFTVFDYISASSVPVQHETVEQGDNKYCSIAAASILAKTARDQYIYAVCDDNAELDERYGLRKNKGYGTKTHLEGLRAFGHTDQHRKSFRIDKDKDKTKDKGKKNREDNITRIT
jgi:ribonuclease HII